VLSILAFIFGASIGSFVQVIASRLHVAPIIKGRSKCLSCGEALRVSDLIPVVSFIFLKGKCRYCKSRYGVSALLIELMYGGIFYLLYQLIIVGQVSGMISLLWLTYYTLLFIVLGVMALYDRAHSYIPIVFLFVFLGLTGVMFVLRLVDEFSFWTTLSPLFVALPFFLVWVVTKGRGLGFGDVLLFLGVGAFFGSAQGLTVLLFSVWMGAIFGLVYKYLIKKEHSKETPIPFVPFIALAFIIVLFTDFDIFSIAMFFS
jgi:leader peptidase (prepilin peptidase)/N-methyltransferase